MKDRNTIDVVKAVVAGELEIDVTAIGDDDDIGEKYGADSMDAVAIEIGCETVFEMKLPDDTIANLPAFTVQALAARIDHLRRQ